MTVSRLAELSNFSKAYISQVKSGKRPPSQRLLKSLAEQTTIERPDKDYFRLFLRSREAMGVSPKTIIFYQDRLYRFISRLYYIKANRKDITKFLNSIPANKNGLATRHASFRAIKTFYRWINTEYGYRNPINGMPAPILGKPIMQALSENEVHYLIKHADYTRDKAIIALFTESGLRLSELASIKLTDIDWVNKTIRIMGKGKKEAYCPFGALSEGYLRQWLDQYTPNGNIWGINAWGISIMLRRLKAKTGLP